MRYIHLNPLRASLVGNLKSLARYRYCGHSTILGKAHCGWQAVEAVLTHFAERLRTARGRYRAFVAKGMQQGRRPELTGGGLVRSAGGWSALKNIRRGNGDLKGDERILGDSAFVEQVLSLADEKRRRECRIAEAGLDIAGTAEKVACALGVPAETVWASGKYPQVVQARSLLCYWLVRELGMSMTELAERFDLSVPSISKSVARGEKIAREGGFSLV